MNEWGLNGRHDWNINDELIVKMLHQTWRKWAVRVLLLFHNMFFIHFCIKVITEQNKFQKGPCQSSQIKSAENNLMFSSCIAEVTRAITAPQVLRGSTSRCRWAALSQIHHQHLHSRTKKVYSHSHSVSTFLKSWLQWMSDVIDLWKTMTHTEHVESFWAGTPTQNLGLRPSRSKSLIIFSQQKLKKK